MKHFSVIVCFVILKAFSTHSHHINALLYGASIATEGEFPFMASLRFNGQHFCGGTIIDKSWILTAGHCINTLPRGKVAVIVGSNALSVGGTAYKVDKLIPNDMFLETKLFVLNDIGLIKIIGEIEYNHAVQPISLCEFEPKQNQVATVIGWGKINDSSDLSNPLRYLHVTIMNVVDCMNREFPLLILGNEVCAIAPRGKGTCNGDSGGPLIYNGTQYGIVSWGVDCGSGLPDVYTNTCPHLNWIKQIMEDY